VQAACVSATGLKYAAVCVRPVAKNIYEYASRGIVCGYIIISLYLGVCFCICISNIPSWHTKIHGERRKCCAASACCACRLCTEKIYISRIVTVLGMESESSAAAASATATEWDGLAAQSADCSSVGFDSVSQVFMWHQVGGSRSRAFWLTCPLR